MSPWEWLGLVLAGLTVGVVLLALAVELVRDDRLVIVEVRGTDGGVVSYTTYEPGAAPVEMPYGDAVTVCVDTVRPRSQRVGRDVPAS